MGHSLAAAAVFWRWNNDCSPSGIRTHYTTVTLQTWRSAALMKKKSSGWTLCCKHTTWISTTTKLPALKISGACKKLHGSAALEREVVQGSEAQPRFGFWNLEIFAKKKMQLRDPYISGKAHVVVVRIFHHAWVSVRFWGMDAVPPPMTLNPVNSFFCQKEFCSELNHQHCFAHKNAYS